MRQPRSHFTPGGTAFSRQTMDSSPVVRVTEKKPLSPDAHSGIVSAALRRQIASRSCIKISLSGNMPSLYRAVTFGLRPTPTYSA
jgi:hypothetical protein